MFARIATYLLVLSALEEALAVALQHPFTRPALDPYADKKRLTFRPEGTFKITIFSDLHFGETPGDRVGCGQDGNSTRLMRAILKDEEPDYVVFNGDLITGDYTFKENSTFLVDQILAPLIETAIPFSSTHGNHDNQVNITHLGEILREQKIAPHLSYTRVSPPGVGGVGGPGNYWVPIYATPTDPAPTVVLWFFDSRRTISSILQVTHRGIELTPTQGGVSPAGTPLPDWVDASVALWIKQQTELMDAVWGPAPRGALAFVHIAPHAIQAVQPPPDSDTKLGLNDDPLGGGSVQDSLDLPTSAHHHSDGDVDTRDAPFWTALGDIQNLHAVISGHAHGNEWCARTDGVRFCFNKHSGYGGYDKPRWGHGVRNVVFTPGATDGTEVETWIRLEDGETRARLWL